MTLGELMRYTGSKAKRCRAVGANLYGNAKFDRLKNAYPPGQHGQARKKRSDYGEHLLEKQKIKWTYGVSERQLVHIYEEAAHSKGVTGTVVLQLLETRLDNAVYRSGLFNSRDQVRQIVAHGHVQLNGRVCSAASARVAPGDKITFRQSSVAFIRKVSAETAALKADWLFVDQATLEIKVEMIPDRDHIDQSFKENLLVEYYSR